MTLYELTDDYKELLEMAEEEDLDEQVFIDTLEGITGALKDKMSGYGKIIRNMECDAASIKAETDRLNKRKKAIENNIKRMKAALMVAMKETKQTSVKTDLFNFRIQANGPSVVIDGDVPDEYLDFKDPTPNKERIKEFIKNNDVEWAHLERTESLRIR